MNSDEVHVVGQKIRLSSTPLKPAEPTRDEVPRTRTMLSRGGIGETI